MKRGRTPTVLQMEAAECGAASLAMVLAHFGRRVPLEDLRLACGVSRDGSKASSLLKAARSYGLTAKGLKAEPDQLRKLRAPMIAFVNFCHFLVVEHVGRKWVQVNDPAQGRQTLSRAEFDECFTGVVLVFDRGEGFRRGDSRPSLARSLLRRMALVRGAVVYAVLVSLVLVIPGLALPIFARIFVDFVVVRGLQDWLGAVLVGMALTACARLALNELRNWHLTRAETRLAIQGARELFAAILRLPIPFFGARYAGEIAGRLDLNDGLAHLLTGQVAQAGLSLATAGFFFCIMWLYSPQLSLVVLGLAAASLGVLFWVSRASAEGYAKLSIQQGKLAGVGQAGLRDVETYKAAGAEAQFLARWTGLHAGVVQTEQAMAGRQALLGVAPGLVASLIGAAILVLGGAEVMAGRLTLGGLVAFQTLSASFIAPLVALMGLGADLQQVRSFTERIDDVLGQAPPPEPPRPVDRLPRGGMGLAGVRFGYLPLEPPLIDGLDLTAAPGARIALVGASGSGKSTVGRIFAGLYAPTAGQVLLDGVPLAAWPAAARQAVLAYVDQTIVLFEGTVRENLTLWDDTVPEADIIAAAQDAMIHDAISARPGGYGARVEEGGRNFSGGQRQRIEIARALVTNPRVLVLDEATNALDTVTEAAVMANLARRGCTLILIAHRLSTIRDCDEIIVFGRGQVLERGRHADLLAAGGAYARLIAA